jgi:predicted nucleic acid-binding protein
VNVTSAVLDARAFVRASVEETDLARHWIGLIDRGETEAFVPDLFYAEVANALNVYVRAGYLRTDLAVELLRTAVDLPLPSRSLRDLAPAALALSLERRLTVYDAAYVALAEAADAVLITADRSLADASRRSELLD